MNDIILICLSLLLPSFLYSSFFYSFSMQSHHEEDSAVAPKCSNPGQQDRALLKSSINRVIQVRSGSLNVEPDQHVASSERMNRKELVILAEPPSVLSGSTSTTMSTTMNNNTTTTTTTITITIPSQEHTQPPLWYWEQIRITPSHPIIPSPTQQPTITITNYLQ